VAVRGDHHTHVHFDGLVAANALDFAFFSTRNNFACIATGISPISSRKSVPPSPVRTCRDVWPLRQEGAFSWPTTPID